MVYTRGIELVLFRFGEITRLIDRGLLLNHVDVRKITPPRAVILLMHSKLINIKASHYSRAVSRIDLEPLKAILITDSWSP